MKLNIVFLITLLCLSSLSLAQDDPTIRSIENKSILTDQLFEYTIIVDDADIETITFSSLNLPEGAELNQKTGRFSWTPNKSQIGDFIITFTVNDAEGHTNSIDFKVTVNPVLHNPVFSEIGNKVIDIDKELSFTLKATDEDGDIVIFSCPNPPKDATLNATTGVFTWTPTVGQEGKHLLTFIVSDSNKKTDEKLITIVVSEVDYNPVLSDISKITIDEEEKFEYQLQVRNSNLYENLTFSCSDLTDEASLNAETGLFLWTPNMNQAGKTKTFSFTVRDENGNEDTKIMTIKVKDIEHAPILKSIGTKSATVDRELRIIVEATDKDNDLLTFTYKSKSTPFVRDKTYKNSAEFTWTPGSNEEITKGGQVRFIVTDETGEKSFEDINIIVGGEKHPPEFESIKPMEIKEGDTLSFSIHATDQDGGVLNYVFKGIKPNSATLDIRTGKFSWKPEHTYTDKNEKQVIIEFRVIDETGLENVTNVNIKVIDTIDPLDIKRQFAQVLSLSETLINDIGKKRKELNKTKGNRSVLEKCIQVGGLAAGFASFIISNQNDDYKENGLHYIGGFNLLLGGIPLIFLTEKKDPSAKIKVLDLQRKELQSDIDDLTSRYGRQPSDSDLYGSNAKKLQSKLEELRKKKIEVNNVLSENEITIN
ncbi:MAG: putative Ig domain-containing protein [Candidatus Hatepunaea meridiana]|nr:putative Ig domain-containing protein [Candidatus Hatepunaea meridiana]